MNTFLRIFNKIIQQGLKFTSLFLPKKGLLLVMHEVGGINDDYNISLEDFNRLIENIKDKNCILAKEINEHSSFICLTFDDVRTSFFTNAYPLLKKNNIPFTLFVATGLLGKEGYITKSQMNELSGDSLCEIGSHTVNHTKYAFLTKEEKIFELEESKRVLSQLAGYEILSFAFPYGSYTACGLNEKGYVRKYYKYGFSTMGIPYTIPSLLPSYFLPRINVDHKFITKIIGKE